MAELKDLKGKSLYVRLDDDVHSKMYCLGHINDLVLYTNWDSSACNGHIDFDVNFDVNTRNCDKYLNAFTRDLRVHIVDVKFNPPATIVWWSDGSKTVVKCTEKIFDPEKGLAMAISKKFMQNKGNYYNEFKKWLNFKEK